MSQTKRALLAAIFSTIFLFGYHAAAIAQERARVAWAGSTLAPAPVWTARDRGFFKKQGIEAEVIAVNSGVTALQALLAKEIELAVISVPSLVASRLGGADTTMIATVVPYFMDQIVTLPSITKPEQLKGKTGGVNRQNTSSDMSLRHGLRRIGIDPDKDVKIIAVGGNPERLAALSRGVIQFSMMGEPFTREAEKAGFKVLVDVGPLKIPFHTNGILTTESFIKAKRPLALRFTRAIVEAIHYIKTDKEGTKTVITKNLRVTDPESLERAYKSYAPIFREAPYPDAEGVKTYLDDLARTNPKATTADPKSFVDLSFVQELESSGFIKQLYGR
ncbi:MAG TPA: ABC transporter substrate-binding protein [Candidatus Binatia bacterium]|jgi:NitT/TauT family transport system substrate-binding protein